MQSLFQQNVSLTLRLIIVMITCITLMTIDHRQQTLNSIRSLIGSYIIYPLQYIVTIPVRTLDHASESLASRRALLTENEQLRTENLQLQTQQLKLASLRQENARLRELLHSSSDVGENTLVAEVITVDQDFYKQQIIINKGEYHGVYLGQAVIDASGVMGQIIEVNRHSSAALLISDASHALPLQSNRSGTRTIAQGKGNPNELDLLHIPNNTGLQPGDLMITSGLGGRFPPNYPVALVANVVIQPGKQFAKVTATPTARLDKSREVLLVWPNTPPQK